MKSLTMIATTLGTILTLNANAATTCKVWAENGDGTVNSVTMKYDVQTKSFLGAFHSNQISLRMNDESRFTVQMTNESNLSYMNARGVVANDDPIVAGVGFGVEGSSPDDPNAMSLNIACSTSPTYGGFPVHP